MYTECGPSEWDMLMLACAEVERYGSRTVTSPSRYIIGQPERHSLSRPCFPSCSITACFKTKCMGWRGSICMDLKIGWLQAGDSGQSQGRARKGAGYAKRCRQLQIYYEEHDAFGAAKQATWHGMGEAAVCLLRTRVRGGEARVARRMRLGRFVSAS